MTPLLFLHGLGGGHHAWDAQLPFFAERGYPAHAWDQPGYGSSPMVEPYDLEQICAALARLIGSLGGEPMVLVGHSMGGFVAQEAYVRYPKLVKGLALCFTSAAFAGGSEFGRQFIAARLGPLDAGKPMAEIAAAMLRTMGSNSKHAESIMAGVPPETYRKAVHLLTTFDRRKELSRIAVPTLLVSGGKDQVAPAAIMEKMARKIPGARYVRLETCGHLGPMDCAGAFNQALLSFLEAHGL
ncbi:MAG: alpha/beta fold hydrolase [Pseudomonadota bacterium]